MNRTSVEPVVDAELDLRGDACFVEAEDLED